MEQTGESSQSIKNRKVINLSLSEIYNPPDENLPEQDLYIKDFTEDLILTSEKKYILRENIMSNEKKVLTIQGERIILDLNSYTLHAAVNHSVYEQRAVIEISNSKDVVIRNGTIKGYTDYSIFATESQNIHLYDVKLLDWSVTAINISHISGLHGARNILMPSNGNMLHKDIYITSHKTLQALKLFNLEDCESSSSHLEDCESSSSHLEDCESMNVQDYEPKSKESFQLDDNLETVQDEMVTINDSEESLDSAEEMEKVLRRMKNIKEGKDEDEESVEDIIKKINKIKSAIKTVKEEVVEELPSIEFYTERLENFMAQNEEVLDGPSLYLDKTLYGIKVEKSSNISFQKITITNLNKMSNTYDYISVNNQIIDAEPYGSHGLLRWKDVYTEEGTFSPNPFIQAQCYLIYHRDQVTLLENREKVKNMALAILTKDENLFNTVAKKSTNLKNKGIIGLQVANSSHVILNKVVIKNAKNRGPRKAGSYFANDVQGFTISAVHDIRMIGCEVEKCLSLNGSFRGYSFERKLTTGQIFKCISAHNEIKAEDSICCSFHCSQMAQLDMFKCASQFLNSPRMTAGLMLQECENVLCRKCNFANHEVNSAVEYFATPETQIKTDGKKSFGILMENTTNCLLSKNNIKDISIMGDSGFSSSMAIGIGALNDNNSSIEDCSLAYINSDQGRSVSILLLGNSTTKIKNNICAWNSPQGFGIIDKTMTNEGLIIGNVLFGHTHENIITRRKIQNKLINIESPSTKGLFKTDKNYILVPEEKENFDQLTIDNKKDRWIINCGKQPTQGHINKPRESMNKVHGSVSKHRESPSKDRETVSKHRESGSKHRESPSKHRESVSKHRESGSKHREPPSKHRESVSKHHETSTHAEKSTDDSQQEDEITEEYTPKRHRRQTSNTKDLDVILKDLPKIEKKNHEPSKTSHSHYKKKHPGMKNIKIKKLSLDDKLEESPKKESKKNVYDDTTSEANVSKEPSPKKEQLPKKNVFEDNFGIENSYDVPMKSKKLPDDVAPPKPPTPKSTGFTHIG